MKFILAAVLALMPFAPVMAGDPGASEASIRELLAATESEKLLDGMYDQIDTLMQGAMQQAMGGQQVNPEQQRIIDDMRQKMTRLYKEEMSWSAFEPMLIEIYRNTFSESEVQSMIAFYKSDGGRAVIAKMPAVLQQSMQAAQKRMGPLLPRIRQIQLETTERLRAACSNECAN
jgi:uncharacterized protein